MKYLLLISLLFSLVLPAFAAEKIEGAFGLALGDVFDVTKQGLEANAKKALVPTPFTPDKPNRAFSEYYVFISPKSHRIYKIIATGKFPDENAGYKVFAAIAAFLNKKYGDGADTGATKVVQNNRSVEVTNKNSSRAELTVQVSFEDDDAARQAGQEQLDAAIKALDTTGL
jgi:hypothetical protein